MEVWRSQFAVGSPVSLKGVGGKTANGHCPHHRFDFKPNPRLCPPPSALHLDGGQRVRADVYCAEGGNLRSAGGVGGRHTVVPRCAPIKLVRTGSERNCTIFSCGLLF